MRVLHHQEFEAPAELRAAPGYDVVSCLACGFAYADGAFAQESVDSSYELYSKYVLDLDTLATSADAAAPTDEPWDVARLKSVAQYLARVVPDRGVRVLDAGCSSGSFLASMAAEGFTDLLGLDPSQAAVATAVRYHRVRAIPGSFVTPPVGIGTFDVIALSHVLEHLPDVARAIASLRVLMAEGGLAYIEVPDASRFAEYLVAPFQDFNTEHINHFSLEILRGLLERHGFEEVDCGRKTVYCTPIDEYPVVFGLWRKTERIASERDVAPNDASLATDLLRYVDESNKLFAEIDARLSHDLAADDEIIVWGAGQLTMKLLAKSVLRTKKIATIVDSSPSRRGMHIAGSQIVAPADLAPSEMPIVIGSLHHEESIVASIAKTDPSKRLVRLYRRQS